MPCGADADGVGTGRQRRDRVLVGVDPALGDDDVPGQLADHLAEQPQVGALGARPGAGVARERGADDVGPGLGGRDGGGEVVAVGHHQHAVLVVRQADQVGHAAAVGARPEGGVDGDDVRARLGDRPGVAQGRGDVDPLVAVLPQPDHGHVDGGDRGPHVVQALHAHRGRAALHDRRGDIGSPG
ncbi:hypothetical protein GCM10011366_25980 [Ornithinimicrobium tianjinense]|uniref:Uncharacterized protein n=1 Tax=Ornithinimicrobium tianjinense TaxID=1195761 RepID=A0A917F958_9MICO|nr:hypothetical protein GCM10011366_25980 [Ornithinimicrobium tianjinense]